MIKEKIEEYYKLILEIRSIIPEYLGSILNEVDIEKRIESVTFTAYRPYFNDGDRCDYSIYSYEDGMEYQFFGKESLDYYDYNYNSNSPEREYINKIGRSIDKKISIIPINIFEEEYGDIKITLYHDSINTEEYTDHD